MNINEIPSNLPIKEAKISKIKVPLPKIKENNIKMSISPKSRRQSLTQKKNSSILSQNENSYYSNKKTKDTIPLKKRLNKKLKTMIICRHIPLNKRNSYEILQTKTKNYYKRFSLDKESSIHYNNDSNINKKRKIVHHSNQSLNSSYNIIEKNLKKTINIMKLEIENKKKINQKKIKNFPKGYKSKLCSSPDLCNLKRITKVNGRLSLCPIYNQINISKRHNSFEYNEYLIKN